MNKFDFTGEKNTIHIGGFYGPHPLFNKDYEGVIADLYKEEIFEMLAEAGIQFMTYFHTDYKDLPEMVEKCLDLGAKHGIGLYVLDSNVRQQAEREHVDVEELRKEIEKYSNHPAFCGIFLADEPGVDYLSYSNQSKPVSKYGELSNVLQYELGYNCYNCMAPAWKLDQNKENYEKYAEEFYNTLKPKVLIWDKYPFWMKVVDREKLREYFFALNIHRERAKKENIPFWTYVQAGSQFNDEKRHFESRSYFPKEAWFQWNINTYLAFGVQGILYFPLIQPEHFAYAGTEEEPAWDFKRNGLIGADGNKTQWFDYAKAINGHIREIGEVLANAENQGVIITSEQAKQDMEYVNCIIESGEFKELLSVSGDALVGCFEYDKQTALYVVNYDMEEKQSIALEFDETYRVRVIEDGQTSFDRTNELKLEMAPGQGVLVVVES